MVRALVATRLMVISGWFIWLTSRGWTPRLMESSRRCTSSLTKVGLGRYCTFNSIEFETNKYGELTISPMYKLIVSCYYWPSESRGLKLRTLTIKQQTADNG